MTIHLITLVKLLRSSVPPISTIPYKHKGHDAIYLITSLARVSTNSDLKKSYRGKRAGRRKQRAIVMTIVCLLGWFLNVLDNNKAISRTVPKTDV